MSVNLVLQSFEIFTSVRDDKLRITESVKFCTYATVVSILDYVKVLYNSCKWHYLCVIVWPGVSQFHFFVTFNLKTTFCLVYIKSIAWFITKLGLCLTKINLRSNKLKFSCFVSVVLRMVSDITDQTKNSIKNEVSLMCGFFFFALLFHFIREVRCWIAFVIVFSLYWMMKPPRWSGTGLSCVEVGFGCSLGLIQVLHFSPTD